MTQPYSTNPFWWEAAPREASAPVAVPETADVAIVGAGYAGLSAARTLAKAGRSVVVFEADAPGQGASSRSGGMVGHGHRLSYAGLQARFGREKAIALLKEGLNSLEFAADLIESEKIDAKWVRTGRFRGAATPADYEAMGPEADALVRDLGMQVEMVPKADMHREIVTNVYHGGIVFHQHGGLHPAMFHQGLLAVAREAGALVCGFTPVTRVSGSPGQFAVHHAGGITRTRDVIICTNGYSGAAVPDIAKRIVGMPSYLIATEPLGANRVRALIPNGRMIVETGSTHLYYRPSPDGERIILGGRAALHPYSNGGIVAASLRLSGRGFPRSRTYRHLACLDRQCCDDTLRSAGDRPA